MNEKRKETIKEGERNYDVTMGGRSSRMLFTKVFYYTRKHINKSFTIANYASLLTLICVEH